eukprot:CAMPEP_0198723858 /NCGR_PEP_ID=MMETSP1475-20131203/1380_1 /TAXON_ID= ORGANISM="Unidentified sp., Strain CCMP1999" /NCGR_SAMPLE_ID=MMETSP1475 /ASSEMBLY_ACC=CAM_ASM_001111 /LENGTH=32 /DNA_ID= /DNA_START= /DNA_END= /DNA_ORIENTATION=
MRAECSAGLTRSCGRLVWTGNVEEVVDGAGAA